VSATVITELEALAVACRETLARLAAAGGPPVDTHLEDLRRWLTRRRPRGGARARRAVATIRDGRFVVPPGESTDPRAIAALAADLRAIDRALHTAHRVSRPL
jgi:Mg-chelatase subunit ChlD